MEKTAFRKILFSSSHFESPFKYDVQSTPGIVERRKLSTKARVSIVCVAIILAVPTLGIGSLVSVYVISATLKYRQQKKTAIKVMVCSSKAFSPKDLNDAQTTFRHLDESKIPANIREVPQTGVSVKIRNLGNTCWLNSMLKFLATDDYLDPLLNTTDEEIREIVSNTGYTEEEIDSEMDKRINLRNHLKLIIDSLRSPAQDQKLYLDPTLISSLMEILHSFNPDYGYYQCDAAEALGTIAALFVGEARNNIELPQITDSYQPIGHDFTKRATHQRTVIVTQSADNPSIFEGKKISIDRCLTPNGEEQLELEAEEGERAFFIKRTILTEAPERLIVNVSRVGRSKKHTNDIDMGNDFTVKVKTHAVNPDENPLEDKEVSYQIVGAILHSGSRRSGHYTFVEATEDGRFIYHNDDNVYEISTETARRFMRKAGTLKLVRIEE